MMYEAPNNSIVYKLRDNIVIKLPYKDFDFNASENYRALLPGYTRKVENSVLILDFSNVIMIDGNGLAALLYTMHVCSEKGIKVIICNLNEVSLNLLKSKGIDKLLDTAHNLKEATEISEKYAEMSVLFNQTSKSLEDIFGSPGQENIVSIPAKVYNFNDSSVDSKKLAN